MQRKLVLLLAALLMFGASVAQAKDIVVGVAGPHSGDLASYGIPAIKAAELVAEKINADGGIDGMMVKVVPQDEQCKPELATNVATKLVSDGVDEEAKPRMARLHPAWSR